MEPLKCRLFAAERLNCVVAIITFRIKSEGLAISEVGKLRVSGSTLRYGILLLKCVHRRVDFRDIEPTAGCQSMSNDPSPLAKVTDPA